MPEQLRRVPIGKLGRPHGVRGEVRLFLFNSESTAVTPGLSAWLSGLADSPVEVEIEKARYAAKFVIVKFVGIDDRDDVDRFKHGHLELNYDDLPELDEDQFYLVELVELPVYVADEEFGGRPDAADPIGRVDRVFSTGANDVIVVDMDDGDELLVPLVEHAVDLIDFEEEVVVLQPLEIWTPAEYGDES